MFELYRRPTPKRPMTTWHHPRGAPVAPFGCASHCQWPDHADRRNFGLGEARGKFENASAAAVLIARYPRGWPGVADKWDGGGSRHFKDKRRVV